MFTAQLTPRTTQLIVCVTFSVVFVFLLAFTTTRRGPVLNHSNEVFQDSAALTEEDHLLPPLPDFSGCAFVGHFPAPDADSVASAIGGAAFFGGVAISPGPTNRESEFLLKFFDATPPLNLGDVEAPSTVCLVDFNTAKQLAPSLRSAKIAGIFDHHTLSNPPVLGTPTFVEIRPWGSCSTIMASFFMSRGRRIKRSVAGLLLGGIISDTLNLRGPTATAADRAAVAWLAPRAGLGHSPKAVDKLALMQFQAKSNLTGASPRAILTSDFKVYQLGRSDGGNQVKVAWGTVECVEPFFSRYKEPVALASFATAASAVRKEKGLQLVFLSVVDVLESRSFVLAPSAAERDVAERMFPGARSFETPVAGSHVFETSPRVSRKKEFIPPLRHAIVYRAP